jgi:hypothetical protein
MLSGKRFLVTILLGTLQAATLHAEINKWSRTGPTGATISISTITVDPKNSNVILAGSFRSGVFRSIEQSEARRHHHHSRRQRYMVLCVAHPVRSRFLSVRLRQASARATAALGFLGRGFVGTGLQANGSRGEAGG